jgi:arginyl-tRNA synthetase
MVMASSADLRHEVAAAVQAAVAAVTGERVELPAVEEPPRPEFGDLAIPAALELGRRLKRQPRQLAEELLGWLEAHPTPGVQRWQIAGPGYLNAFFDRGWVLDRCLEELAGAPPVPSREAAKVIVEHTSINPNKAAHIGHLRNACLGDTLARILRHQGVPVEVQNYIDDTGVQVADVVVGFTRLRGQDAAAIAALPEPFDYTCWDLYTEVTERLEADEQLQEARREVLVALERDAGEAAEIGRLIADRISRRHLQTMGRLGIGYDLLVREGDVVALELWAEALEQLQRSDRVYFAEEGKHAGCWVMRLEGVAGFEDLEEADKVLVRSNGTATYVAKDIAYHMWKYGLLANAFAFERFAEGPGEHVTYRSARPGEPGTSTRSARPGQLGTSTRSARPGQLGTSTEPAFGGADSGFNVIDVRQSYLQQIVTVALAALGESGDREVRHTHFAYEMVALTPRTAAALGIPVAEEDRRRPYVEMSGRRGYGVKADDLLDALIERAAAEVAERNPELTAAATEELGRRIAVGALRYFLVKYARNTVIAFDLDDALSFEGETGPYLQYAVVRARSIFEKIGERWGLDPETAIRQSLDVLDPETQRRLLHGEDAGDLWNLLVQLMRLDRAVAQAVSGLEISTLAKYAFGLAQAFNQVYHRYPILQEEDAAARALRIVLTHAFLVRCAEVLELLGIPVPERM